MTRRGVRGMSGGGGKAIWKASGVPKAHCVEAQDSSKGGAVETGCSGSDYIIGCFTVYYYPNPLHPPLQSVEKRSAVPRRQAVTPVDERLAEYC